MRRLHPCFQPSPPPKVQLSRESQRPIGNQYNQAGWTMLRVSNLCLFANSIINSLHLLKHFFKPPAIMHNVSYKLIFSTFQSVTYFQATKPHPIFLQPPPPYSTISSSAPFLTPYHFHTHLYTSPMSI